MENFIVTISTSGFQQFFQTEEQAIELFGFEEWNAIKIGIHSEYVLTSGVTH